MLIYVGFNAYSLYWRTETLIFIGTHNMQQLISCLCYAERLHEMKSQVHLHAMQMALNLV